MTCAEQGAKHVITMAPVASVPCWPCVDVGLGEPCALVQLFLFAIACACDVKR